ncbi:ribosomal protein L9 domain-containing protein [Loa loa]|uniref:Large ribosomal subunit protein bL9m n=1 Tax=Loa loa TaxID=7209 RepID=A0A1I7VN40_LOALO|nr:ribosomal protein L9 domain-containing protein [Loa loa]EFO28009.1 ribosomal protein L9 domain-containing protein [Loa loa]
MLLLPLCRLLGNLTNNSVVQYRFTWILRRVFASEPTQLERMQRNPTEHPDLMKLEVVEIEDLKPVGPLKVILLRDVEGIGNQFDVVEVNRRLARTDLLLTQKAAYASPFNLQYYGEMKEKMKDELIKRVRIPYDYILLGRELIRKVIPLRVSMESPWLLDKSIVKASLRQEGVEVIDDMIFLENKNLRGPNIELEAHLLRFYVVICNQYVIPMIGRICHTSSDEGKQILYPETTRIPTEEDLGKYNIAEEKPYFAEKAEIFRDFDVIGLMMQRRQNK